MPRYRRHFRDGQTVFLSLATQGRRPWMRGAEACGETLAALRAVRDLYPFVHHAHVLLHDHLHLLLSPYPGVAVPELVGCFKRAAQARLRHIGLVAARLWQPRYHDHIIRDDDDFRRHLDYVHFNPVKHGLCVDAGSWAWSSLSAWQARGAYPPQWGTTPPERIRGMSES